MGRDGTKTVVITGSTRGIGYGLAGAFLTRGCVVAISGRNAERVTQALQELTARHAEERVLGYLCDATVPEQVAQLWADARRDMGRVDIWINNAGVGHAQDSIAGYDPALIRIVIETNLTGAMYGCRVALRGMREQGSGAIYNLEGLGSDGRYVEGMALYGCTKYGLAYLTDALAREVKGSGIIAGALRPGMVATGLLTDQFEGRPEEWARVRRVFNILSDRVETVAPWLAERVLANRRNGVRIRWLSGGKLLWRFLSAPFHPRSPFDDQEPAS